MQFLTRVPVPAIEEFSAEELSRSSAWFPLVGLGIGMLVAALMLVTSHRSMLLAGVVGLVAWVWLTGALHLDGLADLTDALAAAHRDPQRFFAVLADPHTGTFGVVVIVLVLLLKAASLAQLSAATLMALPLVPAWARLGPLAWSRWLPALKAGHGARFAWRLHAGWIGFWAALLLVASLAMAPVLCVGPLVVAGWGVWLKRRLAGVTGDALGAGVEVTEVALLLALSLAGTRGSSLTWA